MSFRQALDNAHSAIRTELADTEIEVNGRVILGQYISEGLVVQEARVVMGGRADDVDGALITSKTAWSAVGGRDGLVIRFLDAEGRTATVMGHKPRHGNSIVLILGNRVRRPGAAFDN